MGVTAPGSRPCGLDGVGITWDGHGETVILLTLSLNCY